jgi:hypothetical protein
MTKPEAKKAQPKEEPKQPTKVEKNEPNAVKQRLATKGLNDAAQLIIDQLPDHAGELLVALKDQYRVELWQYVCGVMLTMHLEGRLADFRLDPAWREGLKKKELECKYCHKMFAPRHIGQPYCSNECGLRADGKLKDIPTETEDIPTETEDKPNDTATSNPVGVGGRGATDGWSDAVEGA